MADADQFDIDVSASGGTEEAIILPVGGDECVAILHRTAQPTRTGIVVVVGGPQYRVGSHRQFVLLARALAAAGLPVLRFDYRGLGDSTGDARDFTVIDADIQAAVDHLVAATGVARVVLWGLCDAASAALMYAETDPRVAGMVLLNPWVHSPATEAQVRLKTYYLSRLRSGDFWRKLLRLDLDWRDSAASILRYTRSAFGRAAVAEPEHFIDRMRKGWADFTGPILLILSGDDLTAGEFRQLATTPAWQSVLQKQPADSHAIDAANHTFARADWRAEVAAATIEWCRRRFDDGQA